MTVANEDLTRPSLIGRSSSHFTRIARIFAAELGVAYDFHILRDIMSPNLQDYGGNPALKIPVLRTARGSWFGTLNVCRELRRHATNKARVLWPEDLTESLSANLQELVLQTMATEVTIVMSKVGGGAQSGAHHDKLRTSLLNMMAWLEQNVDAALAELPSERSVSFLEVSLYCLVMHLSFREVLDTTPYAALTAFCQRFGQRASCVETTFRFDT